MQSIYICAAKRSPIGSFGGSLSTVTATDLATQCLAGMLKEFPNLEWKFIQQLVMGHVLTAGLGQAPARQVALRAGLALPTTCYSVNKVCASGLKAIMLAASSLALDETQLAIAGGMESMSLAPHLLRGRKGLALGPHSLVDHMMCDGLTDAYDHKPMGHYAELCAQKYGISRSQQDDFAVLSYQRAQKACQNETFDQEIVPIEVRHRKSVETVACDEEPLRFSDLTRLRSLAPLFAASDCGTVTAGNASSLNDGAATLLLATQKGINEHNLTALARVHGWMSFGTMPDRFTEAPIGCIKQLLKKHQLSVKDIDLWEINEAFAVVALAAIRSLELDKTKVNVHGGAVALGHPLGCSGARIMVTLLHALKRYQKKLGVAALCIGGGEASAMLIENIS
ncbi:MAG: thiolase family protein [Proteobacteria bacterium]|nr:thiolase family protein [Pseudomonadota bacterium]